MPFTLVLVRHGESEWNKSNLFTGWVDCDLSETGRAEAVKAGQLIKDAGFTFDVMFTSVLKRAILTGNTILELNDLCWLPVFKSWRLNERMYGGLQGLNKKETVAKHGKEQVMVWRRSYATPPPPLEKSHEYHPSHDRRYQDLSPEELPDSECLKDTVERFLPYWKSEIVPVIKSGKRVLISAHGNSLRALVMYLDNISEDVISSVNIPTGIPLVYQLDDDLKPIKAEKAEGPLSGVYLGSAEDAKRAAEKVANQTGK